MDSLGNFSLERIVTTNADGAIFVTLADVDGDGDLDIISASTSDGTVAWYENTNGLGDFAVTHIVTTCANAAQ